jgi:glc operon protein GlcG
VSSFDAWWTAAKIPPVGLGCWRLCAPGRPTWDVACLTIEAAYESGVRLFDTADAYGMDETQHGYALHRLDGALWRTVPIAQGKAAASAAWDKPSGELKDRWRQPVVRALSMMERGRLIPWPGALPIRRADGTMIGAIGVSGASAADDELIAAAGLAVL